MVSRNSIIMCVLLFSANGLAKSNPKRIFRFLGVLFVKYIFFTGRYDSITKSTYPIVG